MFFHCAIEPYRHKSNLAGRVGCTAAASTTHSGRSAALSPANGGGTTVVPPAHGGGSTAASPAGAQRRQRGSVPAAASPVDGGGKVTSLTKYLQLFPFLIVLVVYAVTVLFQDSRVR